MQQAYQKLKELVAGLEDDIAKAATGNKAAGTRVRKAMQEIKGLAQEVRVKVLGDREKEGGEAE